MLRSSFAVHNFIHFVHPQRLTFDVGVNYIIGGNSTGKTAIFELIHRCLSTDINTTTSSFSTDFTKDDFPYALCHFEIPQEDTNKLQLTNLYAGGLFIKKVNDDDKMEGTQSLDLFYTYKVLIQVKKDLAIEIMLARYEERYDCHVKDFKSPKHFTSHVGSETDCAKGLRTNVEVNK